MTEETPDWSANCMFLNSIDQQLLLLIDSLSMRPDIAQYFCFKICPQV